MSPYFIKFFWSSKIRMKYCTNLARYSKKQDFNEKNYLFCHGTHPKCENVQWNNHKAKTECSVKYTLTVLNALNKSNNENNCLSYFDFCFEFGDGIWRNKIVGWKSSTRTLLSYRYECCWFLPISCKNKTYI